jgi:hypothetical protein
MKILSENTIESVSGRNLGFFLGESSHHKASNALNDIPSVQWVAGFPTDPDSVIIENANTGRTELYSYFYVNGTNAINSIYLGKFSSDAMRWSIQFNYDEQTSSPIDPALPYDNFSNEVEIPIRVYNSMRDFVTGQFTYYTDYFKTLEELDFQINNVDTTYIYGNHLVKLKLISEIDILTNTSSADFVGFQINSSSSFVNTDEDGIDRTYYLHNGNFIGIGNDGVSNTLKSNLSITAPKFTESLLVGSWLLVNNSLTNSYDLLQIIAITGDGSDTNDIVLVSNKQLSDFTQLADLTNSIKIDKLFKSTRIGLVRAGTYDLFPNAQVGMSKTYKDYSVRSELVNGGHQYINRNIAKSFSGTMILDRDQVSRLMRFAVEQRAKPFPADMITDMELESPKSIFCIFEQMPEERMSYRTGEVRDVSFTLKQIY